MVGSGRLLQAVSGGDHGVAPVRFVLDGRDDQVSRNQVERVQRFVEQQQIGLLRQALRYEDPLTLTAGEFAEMPVAQAHQVEARHRVVDDLSVRLADESERSPVDVAAHCHDLAYRHRQPVVDLGGLEHVGGAVAGADRIRSEDFE